MSKPYILREAECNDVGYPHHGEYNTEKGEGRRLCLEVASIGLQGVHALDVSSISAF